MKEVWKQRGGTYGEVEGQTINMLPTPVKKIQSESYFPAYKNHVKYQSRGAMPTYNGKSQVFRQCDMNTS